MALAYQHEPFNTLYKTFQYTIAVPFYHFPRWLLSGIPMLWEKKKGTWNLRRHLNICLFRHYMYIQYKTGFVGGIKQISFSDKVGDSNGVWVPPVPDHFVVGDIRDRAESLHITSVPVLGYWIHKNESLPVGERPFEGEKVLLFIHGGGYVAQTAHPDGLISAIPKGCLKRCKSLRRAFSVEYRLSTGPPLQPTNQFPTALLDALAGYVYLVEMGFKAKDIIVMGDSAGGNAAMALTRYLVEHQTMEKIAALPSPPGTLVLLSPWADVSESFREISNPLSSQARFAQYDMLGILNRSFPLYCATSFVGHTSEDREQATSNPYISPASPVVLGLIPGSSRTASFKRFPRTWIEIGGFETLLDQVRRLRDAMVEDMGEERVSYNEVDGAVHDHLVLGWHEPDRTESFNRISKWLEED